MKTIQFDSFANDQFAANPKVRVKIEGGVVHFRPTTRMNPNLPTGEVLCSILPDGGGVQITGLAEDILLEGETYTMRAAAGRGWFTVNTLEASGPITSKPAKSTQPRALGDFMVLGGTSTDLEVPEVPKAPKDLSEYDNDPEAPTSYFSTERGMIGWRVITNQKLNEVRKDGTISKVWWGKGITVKGCIETSEEAKMIANRMSLEYIAALEKAAAQVIVEQPAAA